MKLAWAAFRAIPAPGTTLAVVGIMLGLYAADTWLAQIESRELSAEARSLYTEGEKLLRAGQPGEASLRFERARYLVRSGRDYTLGLANAQLAGGHAGEAKATLSEALELDSNDGRANFLMARALAAENDPSAASFYHRAIYGRWPAHAAAERLKARLELADLLAKLNRKQELLSEVLLLQNEGGPPERVAQFFLEADSAARAAEVYRAILRADPSNAGAYLGLGQAELLRGDFRAARAAFSDAVRRRPEDPFAARQVALAEQLEDLDPTLRRLGSAEKFRRSQRILDLTVQQMGACAPPALSAEAAAMAATKIPASPGNELAESRLSLAGDIWKACADSGKTAPQSEVLAIIHKKLAQ